MFGEVGGQGSFGQSKRVSHQAGPLSGAFSALRTGSAELDNAGSGRPVYGAAVHRRVLVANLVNALRARKPATHLRGAGARAASVHSYCAPQHPRRLAYSSQINELPNPCPLACRLRCPSRSPGRAETVGGRPRALCRGQRAGASFRWAGAAGKS